MMPYNEEPYAAHVRHVKTLERHGVTPPAAWSQLHQRHSDYSALQSPIRDQLTTALLTGKGNIEQLRALAYREQAHPLNVAQADNSVKNAVYQRLTKIHKASAPDAYAVIRTRFDQAASELGAAIAIVDPDTDPVEITKADAKPGVRGGRVRRSQPNSAGCLHP